MLRFGVLAPWDGSLLINARSETVAEKAAFRPWLEQRVAVPMAWYDEWKGPEKQRHHLRPVRDDGLLLAAALWDGDQRFCLLTCAASGAAAEVHGRMPVFLPTRGAARHWLGEGSFGEVQSLLRPHGDSLSAHPASEKTRQGSLF